MSDNVEQDFGFNPNTYLLDVEALQDFLQGADGYITIWYDQMKRNNLQRGASQANFRPQIASEGVVFRSLETGYPYILFDVGKSLPFAANVSLTSFVINMVLNPISLSNNRLDFFNGIFGNSRIINYQIMNANIANNPVVYIGNYAMTNSTATPQILGQYASNTILKNAVDYDFKVIRNNVSVGSMDNAYIAANPGISVNNGLRINYSNSAYYYFGLGGTNGVKRIHEIILWNQIITEEEVKTVHSEQKTFYKIK